MGYIEELRKLIGNKCIILNGSVVIIRDKNDKLLLQLRTYPKGKWNFPGGLMELGESTVETSKREVFEETNLIVDDLKLMEYIREKIICVQQRMGINGMLLLQHIQQIILKELLKLMMMNLKD